MTIASLENSAGEATCVWFEGKNTQEDIFDLVALEVVKKQNQIYGCILVDATMNDSRVIHGREVLTFFSP